MFSTYLENFLPFLANLKLSSAKSFSLEESKIGKGLSVFSFFKFAKSCEKRQKRFLRTEQSVNTNLENLSCDLSTVCCQRRFHNYFSYTTAAGAPINVFLVFSFTSSRHNIISKLTAVFLTKLTFKQRSTFTEELNLVIMTIRALTCSTKGGMRSETSFNKLGQWVEDQINLLYIFFQCNFRSVN